MRACVANPSTPRSNLYRDNPLDPSKRACHGYRSIQYQVPVQLTSRYLHSSIQYRKASELAFHGTYVPRSKGACNAGTGTTDCNTCPCVTYRYVHVQYRYRYRYCNICLCVARGDCCQDTGRRYVIETRVCVQPIEQAHDELLTLPRRYDELLRWALDVPLRH